LKTLELKALRDGWKIDRDNFWYRRKRKGDKPIPEARSDIGADTNTMIYCRSAKIALNYDKGYFR